MRSLIFVFLLICIGMNCSAIDPEYSIESKGAVNAFIIEDDIIYLATTNGCVDIYNWKTKKNINTIKFPMIKDFMGDDIPPKIYSIDKLDDKIVVVSQGMHGFRNIYLITDGKKQKIFDADTDKIMVKKAAFINENQILIGTLGNELMLYDFRTKRFIYNNQISTSVFSDFDLNTEKTQISSTDESGIIHIVDAATGEKIKEYKGMNLDNVYKLRYNNHTIIGAGQDQKASVYFTNSYSNYALESTFIVYAVGLSDDGKWGAFSEGEYNYVKVFNTKTKDELAILKGQKSTLTQINFVEDNYIITSSDDKYIMIWKWR